MMKRILWLFIIAFLGFSALFSTDGRAASSTDAAFDFDLNFAPGSVVRFEHITIEDGLSQNAGLAIFQDSRGYLWIGTQDGLNRYDGYGFKVYKHDPEDPTTISHNSILSMAEDKNGSLWIGTWGGGLNRYDPATETFTRYLPDPKDPASISNGTINSIKGDTNGDLWIATLAGLALIAVSTGCKKQGTDSVMAAATKKGRVVDSAAVSSAEAPLLAARRRAHQEPIHTASAIQPTAASTSKAGKAGRM